MTVHVGESFMRSVTTSYFMTALSTKGDFCFTQKNLPLWLGRNRVTSSDLGWRFVEHFMVGIHLLEDPEMLSSPVSGRVGIQEERVVLDLRRG